LPRRLGPISDALLRRQALRAVRRIGFVRPLLWVNDVTYAPLIAYTGWPAVYDVTDDWLLAPFTSREVARLGRLDDVALAQADEVVVCSPALVESRGRKRPVTLVPNGVDAEHFRRPRPRPRDLPPRPVALYVGSLHEARLDLNVIVDLARGAPEVSIVLVGPDALTSSGRRRLTAEPNVHLLGLRPYADVPAYLQHADVLIVPHLVTPFTESLDPIKAYECLAIDTPTVATPVAGFRELAGALCVVPADGFTTAVRAAVARPAVQRSAITLFGWDERAEAFEAVLIRAMRVAL
jgi:teichuronic acid biosynthesis glycosyltransferase TuaH